MNAINIVKIIAAKNWGADRKILNITYNALVLSKIDYGCIIYGPSKSAEILNPIHNLGMRLALGAFRSSPTLSLLAENHHLPLELRRKKLLINYAYKVASMPDNPAYKFIFAPNDKNTSKLKKGQNPSISERLKEDLEYVKLALPQFATEINNTPNLMEETPDNSPTPITAQATTSIDDEHQERAPPTNFIKLVRHSIRMKWDNEWKESKKTALHEVRNNIFEKAPIESLSRREQVLISRLRIGHTNATHQHLMQRQERPNCSCSGTLSTKHLMLECQNHQEARREEKIPAELKLCLRDKESALRTLSYLKKTGLYSKM